MSEHTHCSKCGKPDDLLDEDGHCPGCYEDDDE